MSDLNAYEEGLAIDLDKAEARIEELEGKLRESALQELSALGQATEAYQAQLAAEARTVDLEVKLEKAVTAIEEMQTASDAMMLHIARTTLAELNGHTDE